MSNVERRTLETQAFPVLEIIWADRGAALRSPRRAFGDAVRRVAADCGVEPNTIRDLFTRRAGGLSGKELYDLPTIWLQGEDAALRSILNALAGAEPRRPG